MTDVEGIKPKQRLLLGLAAQLPSQKRDLFRHAGFGVIPLRHSFRSGAFMAQSGSPFFDRNMTEVRPLCSTGVTPLPRCYGPRRLPTVADRQVIDSLPASSFVDTTSGLPGSLTDLSPRALPNHPERSGGRIRSLLLHRWQASPSPGDWPPPFKCNEAESGSLTPGLAPSLSRQNHCLSPTGSHPFDRPTPRVRLPCTGGRSYMLNEQLTCPTHFSRIDQPGLAWRTRGHRAEKSS